MRYLVVLALLAGVLIMSAPEPVFAETALEGFEDVFLGNENSYLGLEIIKDLNLKSQVLGLDKVGLKVWCDVEVSDLEGQDREYRGGTRLRLIF